MGRLKWPPSEAYAARIDTIMTAWDGYCEEQYDHARMLGLSRGVDIEKKDQKKVTPSLFRAFVRDHNISMKGSK